MHGILLLLLLVGGVGIGKVELRSEVILREGKRLVCVAEGITSRTETHRRSLLTFLHLDELTMTPTAILWQAGVYDFLLVEAYHVAEGLTTLVAFELSW